MEEFVSLTIDTQSVTVPSGTTILKAAQALGITIPTICYHEACTSNGVCRTCVVEVQGSRLLAAACVAQVRQGMVVSTQSPRIERARRTILEMLASAVDLSEAPEIQNMMKETHVDEKRFPEAARIDVPRIDDNPMYVRDYSKCILCWRCVQVCASDAQYAYALNFSGRGFETQISTFFQQPLLLTTCVFCGQCIGVCPTNALKPKREALMEQGLTPAEIFLATRSERKRRSR